MHNSWEGQVTWIVPQRDEVVGVFYGTSGGESWIESRILTNLRLKWTVQVTKLGITRETM
jgi:hypothetical protein